MLASAVAPIIAGCAHVPGVDRIGAEDLDALCSLDGGPAGPFGKAEISAEKAGDGAWGGSIWRLDSPVGPLVRFERWHPDNAHTLRYEGDTSDRFDQELLARRLSEIAGESGWAPLTHEDPVVQELGERYFFKDVPGQPFDWRLWLKADGGSSTTSLYCSREGANGRSKIAEWEDHAAILAKTSAKNRTVPDNVSD